MVSKIYPEKKPRSYDAPVQINFISKYTIFHQKEIDITGGKAKSRLGEKCKVSLELCVIKSKEVFKHWGGRSWGPKGGLTSEIWENLRIKKNDDSNR